jgi:hypothetical protein
MKIIQWLQKWYASNCNGEWEHLYNNVKISTLDNPGWFVEFNLIDTNLEEKEFNSLKIEISENNWIHCWVKDGIFKAAGGPNNLEEILVVFKEWTEQEKQT